MNPQPRFRPTQEKIIAYKGGKVGVSAVPGSGKTFTLSHLAARLVARLDQQGLSDEQEVLVVTFANSAVNSIKAKIGEILQHERGLLPYIGYRVRTLHGLAHDIVRERPSLVGLAEDFNIVDERVADKMKQNAIDSWIRQHGLDLLRLYIDSQTGSDEKAAQRVLNHNLPELALSMGHSFIRQAKDRRLPPADVRHKLETRMALLESPDDLELPLAWFGLEVYEAYQRALSYQGAVDFDDLVRLSLVALDKAPEYLKRLQGRYPFILEDEAQDSSLLQEALLRRLSADGNWVRVGDPNQAINTTFTNADPQFLRLFLDERSVTAHTLDEAGRSARPIIELANRLVRWTLSAHPTPELRNTFRAQDIRPAPPGDPQGNPTDAESRIYIDYEPGQKLSPEAELKRVADSIAAWLPDHPDETVAALVPENMHGFRLAELLRERGVLYEELLRSTTSTRDAAQKVRSVLDYLAMPAGPTASDKLSRLYREVWWDDHLGRGRTDSEPWLEIAMKALREMRTAESFLWPAASVDALAALELPADLPDLYADLEGFRRQMMEWLEASILPIDQLVLTIGAKLFTDPADIALNYKLAGLLRGYALNNESARLPEFVEELRVISQNERRFIGFDDAASGYKPTAGKATVATMHAAKGLEWDRVYLLAVNNYSFPSAQSYDRYLGEKWFIRDRLNLESEILAQLAALDDDRPYVEGEATRQFRLDYAAERLRLLYVGITRARRELIITWNMGRFYKSGTDQEQQPALPLVALWEAVNGEKPR